MPGLATGSRDERGKKTKIRQSRGREGVECKSEREVIMYHLSEPFSEIITIH